MPFVDGLKVETSDARERIRGSADASSLLRESTVYATSTPFLSEDAEAWGGTQGSWSFREATSSSVRLRNPPECGSREGKSPVEAISPPFWPAEELSKILQPSLAAASSPSANARGAARESGNATGGEPAVRAGRRSPGRAHWPMLSGDSLTSEESTTFDPPAPVIQTNSTTVLTHSGGGGGGVPRSLPAGLRALARDLTRRAFNGRGKKPPNLVIDERVFGAGGTGSSVGQSEAKPESVASAEAGAGVSQIGAANAGKLRKLVTNDVAASGGSRDRPLDTSIEGSIAGPESAPAVSLPYLPNATDVIQKGRFTVKLKQKANTIPRASSGRRKFTLEPRDSGTLTVLELAAVSNSATLVSSSVVDRARDRQGRPLTGSWHNSPDDLGCRPWTSPHILRVIPPTPPKHRRTKSDVSLHSASKLSPGTFDSPKLPPRTVDSPTSYYTPSPISTICAAIAGCSINAAVGIASGYVKGETWGLRIGRAPTRLLHNGGGPNGNQATFPPATIVGAGDETEQVIASSASGRRFTVIRKGNLTPMFEGINPTPIFPSPQPTDLGLETGTPPGVLPTHRISVETVSSSASAPETGAAPAQSCKTASSRAVGSNHGQHVAAPASPAADVGRRVSGLATRDPGPAAAPSLPVDAGSRRVAAAPTPPPVPADNSGPPGAASGRPASRASSCDSSPVAAESTVCGRKGRKFVITRHEVPATTAKTATTATSATTAAPPSL